MKKYNSAEDFQMKALRRVQASYSMIPDFKTLLIVLLCIAIDTLFLYGVTDSLFRQSQMMSVCVAVMMAFCIDGLPVVIATKIQKERKDKLDIVILVVCVLAFFLMIVAIFALRWSMMEMIYSTGDGIIIDSNMGLPTEEDDYVASNAEKIMTVVMSIIPFITSMITFAAATHKSVRQKKFETLQRVAIEREAYKQERNIKIHETERELKRDLNILEKNKLANIRDQKIAMLKLLDAQTRIALAKKIGNNPEIVSQLLEEVSELSERKEN